MVAWQTALAVIGGYIATMLLIAFVTKKAKETAGDFLVMNRQLGTFRGAFSIAASWIWAPAVFICSQKSYEQGLPGIFWFTFPNILCFFTFVPLALRARKLLPHGFSMPDYLYARFAGNSRVHIAALIVYFGYQSGAIVINALAGGTLVHTLTGLPITGCIIFMTCAALSYSLISGLRASVITDAIQMCFILFIAFVLVPWVLTKVGGFQTIVDGLGGKSGDYTNIFDPSVAYSFGIAATIGLISGPVADQMWFQRAFAAKQSALPRIFMIGGLAFGIVPIVLSSFGFIAAAPAIQSQLPISEHQMVGPEVVAFFLPKWALIGFVLMAFAGLSSVLDSAFAATSSLMAVDVYKRYIKPQASGDTVLKVARLSMLAFAVVNTGIALLRPQLIWCFLIYGSLASTMLVPVIFSLFSRKVTASGVICAIVLSLAIGVPLSIYANVMQNVDLVVLAAVLPPIFGLASCIISVLCARKDFDYEDFSRRLADEAWRNSDFA